MPLSTELKWLSTFELLSGQANYWFQNFVKSNTYHRNETHWVKPLNYTSCDNWRSFWATDKVREGPWTVGGDGQPGDTRTWHTSQQLWEGQWSSNTAVPQLISYSDKQLSAYPTKGRAWPQREWKWGGSWVPVTLSPRALALNCYMH